MALCDGHELGLARHEASEHGEGGGGGGGGGSGEEEGRQQQHQHQHYVITIGGDGAGGDDVEGSGHVPNAGMAEEDGVHYHFAEKSAMEREIAEGKFLEHARVHANIYGTSLAAVEGVSVEERHLSLVSSNADEATDSTADLPATVHRMLIVRQSAPPAA